MAEALVFHSAGASRSSPGQRPCMAEEPNRQFRDGAAGSRRAEAVTRGGQAHAAAARLVRSDGSAAFAHGCESVPGRFLAQRLRKDRGPAACLTALWRADG